MKKLAKVLGAALLCMLLVVGVFTTACDNGNPAPGNDDNPPVQTHECQHACPVCGGCLDMECDNPGCAVKCGDDQDYESSFEVTELKVAKSGVTYTSGTSYVSGFSKENQAAISYRLNADMADTVTLIAVVLKTAEEDAFTDVVTVKVNGVDLNRKAFVPALKEGENAGAAWADVNLGCVDVVKGVNTITFIAEGNGVHSHNFKQIRILGNPEFELEQADEVEHECTSVCPVCGGCTDFSCYNIGCAKKCVCESGAPATLFWVCDERCVTSRAVNPELDGIGCTWNQETRITYTINSSVEGTVKLGAVVSNDTGDVLFTDQFKVTVNGQTVTGTGMMPVSASGKREWNTYKMVVIGEIQLKAGKNVIIFSQTPKKEVTNCAYNFQSMIVFAEGKFDWWDFPEILDHSCPVCGKCTDAECTEHTEKCDCVEVTFEGMNDNVQISGANKKREDENCIGLVQGGYNQNCSIFYTLNSDKAGKAKLIFDISCLPTEPEISYLFTIKVNGNPVTTEAKVPKGTRWTQYQTVEIGACDLLKGRNAIEISYLIPDSGHAINFRSLIVASQDLSLGWFEGHDMTAHDAVPASCDTAGNIAYWTCTCCGKVWADAEGTVEITMEQTVAPALGHDYASELTVEGAKTVYEPGESFSTENLVVKLVCSRCGDKVLSAEEYTISKTAPLDVSDASVTISYELNGTAYSKVVAITVAHTHKLGELVPAVEEDCVTPGNVAYYECSVCHKYYADPAATQEIETIVIPARGHSFENAVEYKAATCVAEGNPAYVHCTDCDKYFTDTTGTVELESVVLPVDPDNHTEQIADDGVKVTCSLCNKTLRFEFSVKDRRVEANKTAAAEGMGGTWGKETAFTYKITASQAGKVTLSAVVSQNVKELLFTDVYKIYLNGSETPLAGTGKLPAHAKTSYTTYDTVVIGEFDLVSGENTLAFSFTPVKEADGGYGVSYNFLNLYVMGEGEYGWSAHICSQVCPICGGCLDADCTEEACATKCSCGTSYVFNGMDDHVVLTGLNKSLTENCLPGKNGTVTTITYTIHSDVATTAKLYANCSAISGSFKIAFTATWSVKVNGSSCDDRITTIHHNYDASRGAANRYSDYVYEYVCEIELKAGVNVIVLEGTGKEQLNFRDLAFTNVGNAKLTFAELCPVCGGCLTDECADRCTCVTQTPDQPVDPEEGKGDATEGESGAVTA